MNYPYVIDNQTHRLVDVIGSWLEEFKEQAIDIAATDFSLNAFKLLRSALFKTDGFRLLLGADPCASNASTQLATAIIPQLIRADLESIPFDEEHFILVKDLISFLSQQKVDVRLYYKGFLRAHCYFLYAASPDHAVSIPAPSLGIVGTSSFTESGLTSPQDLNLAHYLLPAELLPPSPNAAALPRQDTPAPEPASAASAAASPEADPVPPACAAETATAPADESQPAAQPEKSSPAAAPNELRLSPSAAAIKDIRDWYENHWREGWDFKSDFIKLLDASKFGRQEYTPYQVYMKTLYEYFLGEGRLEANGAAQPEKSVEELHRGMLKHAERVLARYNGVLIVDGLGAGKFWLTKMLLENLAARQQMSTLLVCPAAVQELWEIEIPVVNRGIKVLTHEELGNPEFDPEAWRQAQVVVVDQSHNFTAYLPLRTANLKKLLVAINLQLQGKPCKLILLTATPIVRDLMDLYHQISLITYDDRSFLMRRGIDDLQKCWLAARGYAQKNSGIVLVNNVLDELAVRHTRTFVRRNRGVAVLGNRRLTFPKRRLKTIMYSLKDSYSGFFDHCLTGIANLKLAPFFLEPYRKSAITVDLYQKARGEAMNGIFKTRYLKRLESSVEALRVSLERALAYLRAFLSSILLEQLPSSGDIFDALNYLLREAEEDDALPRGAAEGDATAQARAVLDRMKPIDPMSYNLRQLRDALKHDEVILTELLGLLKPIGSEQDAKLQGLKKIIGLELRGKKVLIFSQFRDTVRYLYHNLGNPNNPDALRFCQQLGGIKVRFMDSSLEPQVRLRLAQAFAPRAFGMREAEDSGREIDILIATDVISECMILQDAQAIINYDLAWQPQRLTQRAACVDRRGSPLETLPIYSLIPERGFEELMRVFKEQNQFILSAEQSGYLELNALGLGLHPKDFETVMRVRKEDHAVLDEIEVFSELLSLEAPLRSVKSFLAAGGDRVLTQVPAGVHSGLAKPESKGIFFYFQANVSEQETLNIWRFYNLKTNKISDNHYLIANAIACEDHTVREVTPKALEEVFPILEKVVGEIINARRETCSDIQEGIATDPVQQSLITTLTALADHPEAGRHRVAKAARFLDRPLTPFMVQQLLKIQRDYQQSQRPKALLLQLEALQESFTADPASFATSSAAQPKQLRREDLKLVCFEFVG